MSTQTSRIRERHQQHPDAWRHFCFLEMDNTRRPDEDNSEDTEYRVAQARDRIIGKLELARQRGKPLTLDMLCLEETERNVVLVFPASQACIGNLDAIYGVYGNANSYVAGGEVAEEYLRENCVLIPERLARQIHPRAFAYLESCREAARADDEARMVERGIAPETAHTLAFATQTSLFS